MGNRLKRGSIVDVSLQGTEIMSSTSKSRTAYPIIEPGTRVKAEVLNSVEERGYNVRLLESPITSGGYKGRYKGREIYVGDWQIVGEETPTLPSWDKSRRKGRGSSRRSRKSKLFGVAHR